MAPSTSRIFKAFSSAPRVMLTRVSSSLIVSPSDFSSKFEDFQRFIGARKSVIDEVIDDVVVLFARQKDAVCLVRGPSRSADLLIISDHGTRPLKVNDERQVRLVETHAEGDRRHQGFQFVVEQSVFEGLALRVIDAAVIGPCIDSL